MHLINSINGNYLITQNVKVKYQCKFRYIN